MQITLPDEMRELLEDRARRAGLKSVEEYVLAAVLAAEPEQMSVMKRVVKTLFILALIFGPAIALILATLWSFASLGWS